MREHLASGGRQRGIRQCRIVGGKEDADEDEGPDHREVDHSREDRREGALTAVLRRQHPLHRVLVDAVGGHRHEGGSDDGRPDRVVLRQHVADPRPESLLLRFGKIEEGRLLDLLHRGFPATRDFTQQEPDREPERRGQHSHLDEVGPDHRTDPADRRVDRGGQRDEDQRHGEDPELLLVADRLAFPQAVGEHEDDRRDIQARPHRQHPGDKEGRRGDHPGQRPEAGSEELVERHHAVPVEHRDEQVADDDPRQQGADRELRVGPVVLHVAGLRGPEEGGGADFGGEDRCKHGPPRRLPVAEREAFHRTALGALRKADCENHHEVGQEHQPVDPVLSHAGL